MKPVLSDLPDSFETERLTIRSPLPGDGAELQAALVETHDDLRPWLESANHLPTVEEQEELVRRRFSGQGYITEAMRGITHFAFETLGARRMEIRCDARNVRSIAVAERSGYALEATLHRHMVTPDGALRDTLIFSRLEPVGLPGTGIVDKDD
jgi:hypothetical protein